jgi:hypothetical protein
MPFYLNYTNGTSLATVADGVVDKTTTSITLLGKNFPTYGQSLNQNLVSMLENFANSSSPNYPMLGQLWYDTTNKTLNVYREGSLDNFWQKIAVTVEGTTQPTDARLGDLWYDTTNSQLKLYDTTINEWRIIGPQTTNEGQLSVSGSTFDLQIQGNTVFSVDQYGGVNFSRNPCFWGYNNATESDLYTANIFNTWVPKPANPDYSSTSIDAQSNFDTETGFFTVNTTGLYSVYTHVSTLGGTSAAGSNSTVLQWQLDEADAGINARNDHTTTTVQQLVCSGVIRATQGQRISLAYKTSNSSTTISHQYSSYSIQLVG